MSRKRQAVATDNPSSSAEMTARVKRVRGRASGLKTSESDWPDTFRSLFKIYKVWPRGLGPKSDIIKALNTVLAFCSSRKHIATTFASIRSSVESLLRTPLDLNRVAEIKALLPDLVKFAYIPKAELVIHGDVVDKDRRRRKDDDIYSSLSPGQNAFDDQDHVLVLEFVENRSAPDAVKGSVGSLIRCYTSEPSLTSEQVNRLIRKRNERFVKAVEELLAAARNQEHATELLLAAARDHVPVNPNAPCPNNSRLGDNILGTEQLSMTSIIDEIVQQDWYVDQIAHRHIVEPRPTTSGKLDAPLSATVAQAILTSKKISTLYAHQTAAINAMQQKKNVIVSTSTASGKSIIYQVPVLTILEEDKQSTALFVYPTKALAQDQRATMEQLLSSCFHLEHLKAHTYDGDTPQELRRGIRETASIIFTNFDMLHNSILPHEDIWRRFLKNLKLVVVDELHYYSGLFGSHVALVIRRFRRVCAAVGNRQCQFVSCSATIANPGLHMKRLFGLEEVEVVTEDGAPAGRKEWIIWNPPYVDPVDPAIGRRSPLLQATQLMRFLMQRGIKTILFCKIRKICEMAMKTLRAELTEDGRLDILQRVMAYRGGYSREDRRKIEREAFSGNLLGLCATNALELGIDIGALDAVIMLGVPFGGVSSLRQQGGRAGRRTQESVAILVADVYAADQYFVKNPEILLTKPISDLVIDPDNAVILELHLQCAAFEMPLSSADEKYFGPTIMHILETRLVKDEEGWYHTHGKYMPFPSKHVALRGAEEESYSLVDITGGESKVLEEMEHSRAIFEAYEGAVFIHQGLTFVVTELSHDSKIAKVLRTDVNYTTSPRDFTDVDAKQTFRIREVRGSRCNAFYGRVELVTVVYGYYKLRHSKILDAVAMESPPFERETTGFWLDVQKHVLDLMVERNIIPAEGIHAAAHAIMNRFALAHDLKTECKLAKKEYKAVESKRKRPARLIFYDAAGFGAGPSANAFDHVSDLVHSAFEAVESCRCENGCVKCVESTECKENNEVSSKLGAKVILRGILNLPLDQTLPSGSRTQYFNTIVVAPPVRMLEGVQVEASTKQQYV